MNRDQRIINYFLILQAFKYDRGKASAFYIKYSHLMDKRIHDSLLDIEKADLKMYKNMESSFTNNAFSVFDSKKNGNILLYGDDDYPARYYKSVQPPIVVFYKGDISLLKSMSVSVVGTRKPTDYGGSRTVKFTDFLVKNNLVVVSGLALGIDEIAHKYCFEMKYKRLIGVIGTPLNIEYPKKNSYLQTYITENGLLLSEYPSFESTHKWSFLRRNYLMSITSKATVVIEAGNTSGAVNQARNTIENNGFLFIPKSTADNPTNDWPKKMLSQYSRIFIFEDINQLNVKFHEIFDGGNKDEIDSGH